MLTTILLSIKQPHSKQVYALSWGLGSSEPQLRVWKAFHNAIPTAFCLSTCKRFTMLCRQCHLRVPACFCNTITETQDHSSNGTSGKCYKQWQFILSGPFRIGETWHNTAHRSVKLAIYSGIPNIGVYLGKMYYIQDYRLKLAACPRVCTLRKNVVGMYACVFFVRTFCHWNKSPSCLENANWHKTGQNLSAVQQI